MAIEVEAKDTKKMDAMYRDYTKAIKENVVKDTSNIIHNISKTKGGENSSSSKSKNPLPTGIKEKANGQIVKRLIFVDDDEERKAVMPARAATPDQLHRCLTLYHIGKRLPRSGPIRAPAQKRKPDTRQQNQPKYGRFSKRK